jgi:hypothetical protein
VKKRARRRSPIDSINSGRIVSDQVFELCLSRESECGGDATCVSPARCQTYKTFLTLSLTLWTIKLACFAPTVRVGLGSLTSVLQSPYTQIMKGGALT